MKKAVSLVLCIAVTLSLFTVAFGYNVENTDIEAGKMIRTGSNEFTYINPLYADVISGSDLLYSVKRTYNARYFGSKEYCTTLDEAASILRKGYKARNGLIQVSYFSENKILDHDAIADIVFAIPEIATAHTGVPTEGDYLEYQYASWNCNYSLHNLFSSSYLDLTYEVAYYTTAEDEAKMDEAVAEVLKEIEIGDEYTTIKSIYDYICQNVVYDDEHVDDTSYKYQYTAYAALINGTAVCQGYALLFYRLALELGIDCRVMPGLGNGSPHAWNIVKIGDYYYNVDSTWDAPLSVYRYFLKCDKNFSGHKRSEELESSAYDSKYVISDTDYVYTPPVVVILYGDVNDDEIISMPDLVLLCRYLADYDYDTGYSSVEVGEKADTNGDGIISSLDILRLCMYLASFDSDTGTSAVQLGPQTV